MVYKLSGTPFRAVWQRHEELDWHGRIFPGPGNQLFESLTKMVCTWLMFAFDCHLGRKVSGSSVKNSPQDSCMLTSFQRADSEGCGWGLVCHSPDSVHLTAEDHCSMLTEQSDLWGSGWGPAVCSVHPGLYQKVSGITVKYQSSLQVRQVNGSLTERPSLGRQDRKME